MQGLNPIIFFLVVCDLTWMLAAFFVMVKLVKQTENGGFQHSHVGFPILMLEHCFFCG